MRQWLAIVVLAVSFNAAAAPAGEESSEKPLDKDRPMTAQPLKPASPTRDPTMPVTSTAKGSFTVDMRPMSDPDAAPDAVPGRMSLDKRFEGDLSGTGRGQMLTAMTAVKGSAGYVAIERVTGTLHGRSGSFALQHSGTMNRGAPTLSINVVPDSGTDALAGIAGVFTLMVADGKHLYELAYSLPD